MTDLKLLVVVSLIAFFNVARASNCRYEIVESVPDLLNFKNPIQFKPAVTHETLIDIINHTNNNLKIASFYVTLSAEPEYASHPSTKPGKDILVAIEQAVERGVKLQVVLDRSTSKQMSNENDIEILKKLGTVRFLNMTRLLKSGVLHSKFMISDDESFYIGSSNFDWRSYTQIKEIGIAFYGCKLAKDLDKVFQTYMLMAEMDKVPSILPDYLNTTININNPYHLQMDNLDATVFLSASPPAFNGVGKWVGRTDDIDGLLSIIDNAQHKIDISVMNYSPRVAFGWPKKFWPRIDDALRRAAAERKVVVRLLFSNWSREEEMMWYRSLNAVQSDTLRGGGIHVKIFKVPAFDDFQKKLPYSRVKHDKYMVTDGGLYIGTSNWSPDYFINTCGVGVVIHANQFKGDSVITNMQDLFERDFTSEFASELPPPAAPAS